MKKWIVTLFFPVVCFAQNDKAKSWIRINQLGYTPNSSKVAVWCGKESPSSANWQLVDVRTNKFVTSGKLSEPFGAYGPFTETYRIDFSSFRTPGHYYLQTGNIRSPEFEIGNDVYKGTADFCLRYMRQQRSGFNPFLKDSCHTHDGYVLYGEKAGIKDSTYVDVVGGWHDASDYLQYAATSANATYHLLMAYRDFPKIFTDEKLANGLDGKNGLPDVLDEAKWGLDWLLKMHPRADWMFNQIGDDRDHMGMRIPKQDTNFYGRGLERPVYFLSGEPQQRGKFMNATTGKSSTAAKFSSAFSLGAMLFDKIDYKFAAALTEKSLSALRLAMKYSGVSQTASVRSPYIYAEDNWTDDMELALASRYSNSISEWHRLPDASKWLFDSAYFFATKEPITPWLGKDTAKHYQWYPFINIGHYELARQKNGGRSDTAISYYKKGIELVWNKAKANAFYRGIPFIWCSNNLTVAFATQCRWYRQLTGDKTYERLGQANFDWLFGCNPWGTSMVYRLPSMGDTPVDPHSAFTHLKNYPIDGGLVDGPVYGSIYKNLIGINLHDTDEYEEFQSDLAVYHDDYGDYSTNEPTMDGTASLIYLLAAKEDEATGHKKTFSHGAIIRGDSTAKNIAIVFTGHEFAEGGESIRKTLKEEGIKASFFLTGQFYNKLPFKPLIEGLRSDGHYLGAHSDAHLLYCDWNKRDSLLVSKADFIKDLENNYDRMKGFGIRKNDAKYFLPPYEWYNDSIASWTGDLGIKLISYTPGTLSHADYTTTRDKNYRSSESIYRSIFNYEYSSPSGLNGFILLMHIGAGPERPDKFYTYLPKLIKYLKAQGYQFQRVDELLKEY
jgi:endoglucanase